MTPALLIRLRPRGPWRPGPADGALDRVDTLFRSDRLFSAVTLAMRQLGLLDEWLGATARASVPMAAFSSLFPYQGETLFAAPPAALWPPPPSLVRAPNPVFLAKIRWSVARFVPLSVIDALISGTSLLADQWLPDPESGCLLRRDRPSTSPFRVTLRRIAAVDRATGVSGETTAIACTEFEPEAGLWTVVRFASEEARTEWRERIEAAFRLLADSGFGGRRTSGWGQSHPPLFHSGDWPSILLPKTGRASRNGIGSSKSAEEASGSARYWLLSLYSPASGDRVQWDAGQYELVTRAGRTSGESGSGIVRQSVRMVSEGSVVEATGLPTGAAVDVAPQGFAHPVYCSGLALALELPATAGETTEDLQRDMRPVEEPAVEEAIVDRPCQDPGEAAPSEPERAPEPQAEAEAPAAPETPAGAETQADAGPETAPEPEPPALGGSAGETASSSEQPVESGSHDGGETTLQKGPEHAGQPTEQPTEEPTDQQPEQPTDQHIEQSSEQPTTEQHGDDAL